MSKSENKRRNILRENVIRVAKSLPPRADRETDMTNIIEPRVIGNQADMGGPAPAAARIPLTVTDILRAGVRRRVARGEMVVAQSAWDSEGGASREDGSLLNGGEGRAPRGLGG